MRSRKVALIHPRAPDSSNPKPSRQVVDVAQEFSSEQDGKVVSSRGIGGSDHRYNSLLKPAGEGDKLTFTIRASDSSWHPGLPGRPLFPREAVASTVEPTLAPVLRNLIFCVLLFILGFNCGL